VTPRLSIFSCTFLGNLAFVCAIFKLPENMGDACLHSVRGADQGTLLEFLHTGPFNMIETWLRCLRQKNLAVVVV